MLRFLGILFFINAINIMNDKFLIMDFNLKTNYKRGDWFKAEEANATNKAILSLDATQKTYSKDVDKINGKIGDGILKTESGTIIGAINELVDSSVVINNIEKGDIDELFPKQ